MKAATPFPLEANGRSVALTGMIPSSRAKTRIKLLTVTKRFMMISFISIQKFGPHTGVTEIAAIPYVLKWSIIKEHHIRFFENQRLEGPCIDCDNDALHSRDRLTE